MSNLRTTSSTFASRAIRFSAQQSATLGRLQQQISSGVRLRQSSDDPIAFRQVTTLSSRRTELAADRRSIDSATSILNTGVVQLQEFSDIVTRARSLAQQGVQALDSNQRTALALEVDELLNRLQTISSAEFGGSFIFSGTRSTEAPYTFEDPRSAGGTLEVTYNGSNRNSQAFVGEAVSVDTFYSGADVFASSSRTQTLVFGNTGVQNGSGTDTLVGRAGLQITNDTTTFLGGSGLRSGASADRGDTVIGLAGVHTIEIVDTAGDGSAGTISLNGGTAQAFTNSDLNLELTGPDGKRVFVDTTAITAGFNGVIDLEATGNVSIDGGVTQTAITFSDDQILTDQSTGRFVTLNTTGITSAGTDSLEFPGTTDAFQTLFELSVDLRNERGLSVSEAAAAVGRRLDDLDRIGDRAFQVLGEQSTSLQTLASLRNRIEDLELSVEVQLSDIQATDLPEAVLQLENSQQLLQFTFAVTAQISNLGILEFLR